MKTKVLTKLCLLVSVFALFLICGTSTTFAAEKIINVGDHIDVGTVGTHMNLRIVKQGEYYLRGSSAACHVTIESGGVTLYLEDGLSMKLSSKSTWGFQSPAIEVKDQGGEVRIVTMPGAKADFQAYNDGPAIKKNGTNTKLVFDTKDHNNPGRIWAKGGTSGGSPGIGSWDKKTFGNVYFVAGNIEARGDNGGPGIGAGGKGSVDGLYFQGAHVVARGWYVSGQAVDERGAGIGTCYKGVCKNIEISGGYVEAYSGEYTTSSWNHDKMGMSTGYYTSAGIGAGRNSNVDGIRITGGEVLAYGGDVGCAKTSGGAGIGGADPSRYVSNIDISGGKVYACGGSGAAGIGAGSGENTELDITITGGDITAESKHQNERYGENNLNSGGVGIGCAQYSSVKTTESWILIMGGNITANGSDSADGEGGPGIGLATYANYREYNYDKDYCHSCIDITGGHIVAKGGKGSPAIGAMGNKEHYQSVVGEIDIEGGTIDATSTDAIGTIGGYKLHNGWYDNKLQIPTPVYITGGNIKTNEGIVGQPIYDDDGVNVYETIATLDQETGNPIVSKTSNIGYGLTDVTALAGKLYFYLPKDTTFTSAMTVSDGESAKYRGSIPAGESGILKKLNVCQVTLVKTEGGKQDGSAAVFYDEDSLSSFTPAVAGRGQVIQGYNDAATGGNEVISKDGRLRSNVAGYTNENKRWINEDSSATLYAQYRPSTYKIIFNGNSVPGASTSLSGEMGDLNIDYGDGKVLPECGYSLPGYGFKGYSLSEEGTQLMQPGDDCSELTGEDHGEVTVYAIWEPLKYDVIYSDGDGHTEKQTMTFDKTETLRANTFTKDGYLFSCWKHTGNFGANRTYNDGAQVRNLCAVGSDGTVANVELEAAWWSVESRGVIVSVNKDNKGLGGVADKLVLEADGTTFTPFAQHGSDQGTYRAAGETLPEGEYNLMFKSGDNLVDTGKDVTVGPSTSCAFLEFYSVDVTHDENLKSAGFSTDAAQYGDAVIKGARIKLTASNKEDSSYVFGKWVSTGVDPLDDTDTIGIWSSITNPKEVNIVGKTEIKAISRMSTYDVKFDANGGDGEMDVLTIPMHEEKTLPTNQFTRQGYYFNGWNTKADGSGAAYEDGATVSELTAQDHGTVTLYAQWKPFEYYIQYRGNGGVGSMIDQKCFYGNTSKLKANKYTRKNYHFTGWNTEAGGTGNAYENQQTIKNLVDEDEGIITLYAQWEKDTYTVKFKANGGSGSMKDQIIACEQTSMLNSNEFTRDKYEFTGWNTAADGSGTAYTNEATIKGLAESGGTVTLYAQWKRLADPVALLKGTTKGNHTINLTWNKVAGADEYILCGSLCNTSKHTYKMVPIAAFGADSNLAYTAKYLKSHRWYKYQLLALKEGKLLCTSNVAHVVTGNISKPAKYANAKTITLNKKSVTVKVGATSKVKASVKNYKGKKSGVKHGKTVKYVSGNNLVATVSQKGVIKGKSKGTCYVYAQAINGKWAKVKVVVK